MGAVTYIDEKRDYRTFKFSLIEKYGCTKEVFTRLKYAKTIVERIMQSKSTGRHKSTSQINSNRQIITTKNEKKISKKKKYAHNIHITQFLNNVNEYFQNQKKHK